MWLTGLIHFSQSQDGNVTPGTAATTSTKKRSRKRSINPNNPEKKAKASPGSPASDTTPVKSRKKSESEDVVKARKELFGGMTLPNQVSGFFFKKNCLQHEVANCLSLRLHV